jgi:hypothetical protein
MNAETGVSVSARMRRCTGSIVPDDASDNASSRLGIACMGDGFNMGISYETKKGREHDVRVHGL